MKLSTESDHTQTGPQSDPFGAFIRAAREKCGLSLAAAAERLQCSRQYVLRIEQAKVTNPTIQILANMAVAYGIPIADIAARAAHCAPGADHRRALAAARPPAAPARKRKTPSGF